MAATETTWDDTYKWLLAWLVAIMVLTLINKTRIGHVFIYYWLWLLILFLVVTQYKYIAAALGPLGQPAPGGQINGGASIKIPIHP
jgi:hypothetical protein